MRKIKIKTGDFVRPITSELKTVLDKTYYLVERTREYNKNSFMIKLQGHSPYFNSDDFEVIKTKSYKICECGDHTDNEIGICETCEFLDNLEREEE